MAGYRIQLGMTLTELVFGLALGAILLSLSLPSLGDFMANQRVIAASNHLIAHLQYARQEAVTRRHHVIACPSADQRECNGNLWDSGWIVFVDPDRDGRINQTDQLLRVVNASEHVRIHSGGRERARFQPSGGAYGSNLTLRVCPARSGIEGRAVVVSNPGRVRMESRIAETECAN